MKNFVKRIINAVKNINCYENESLLVSLLALLVIAFYKFFTTLFALVCLITLLVWLLPFLIYWHFESKGQDQE